DAVPYPDPDRSAAAPLADQDDDDRDVQQEHVAHGRGDRLADPALLGGDAAVGRGRIDQAEDRTPALLGQAHEAHRLAVALRAGAAEVAEAALVDVAALLLPDHRDPPSAEARDAAHHRRVVGEAAVAVELHEVVAHQADVVEGIGAGGMAGDEGPIPGRE